jgi:hypothetical protein
MKARVLVFVAALSAACRSDPPPAATTAAAPAWLVLRAAGDAVDFGTLRVEPAAAVEQRSRQGTRFVLAIRSAGAGGTLRIDTEQSCPLSVPLSELVAGRVLERELVPWLDFGGPYSAVGFDKPVAIDVRAGCPEAAQGRIEWRLVRGSAPPMRVEARGFRLELSTPRARSSVGHRSDFAAHARRADARSDVEWAAAGGWHAPAELRARGQRGASLARFAEPRARHARLAFRRRLARRRRAVRRQ